MIDPPLTRRDLIRASAGAAALGAVAPYAFAQAPGTLKVGVIGTGGRGTGAAVDIARSSPGIEVVALADLFPEHLERARKAIQAAVPGSYKVTDETAFVGLDAYKQVIASDCDIVLCAGYPHFRPLHVESAVNAGKHVFAEKPIAVDPVGVRRFMKAGEVAKERGLGVLAGTQRRHATHYRAAVQAAHDGRLGNITGGSLFYCRNSGRTPKPRLEGESDMDWMLRNWWWFNWLSGGMIGQLLVHVIDIMHWVMGGPCRSAYGSGGRAAYTQPIYGNIFDHFAICYEYPDGEQFHAQVRQTPNSDRNVSEMFMGSKGRLITTASQAFLLGWDRSRIATYKQEGSPYIHEHTHFVESIRAGEPLNESKQIGESTMMAVMGQLAGWTAKKVEWDWAMNESELDLTPPSYEQGEVPPVPVPGTTPLI